MLKYYIQKILWSFNYDLSRLNYNSLEINDFYSLLKPIKLEDYELKRFGNQSVMVDIFYLMISKI